MIKRSSPTLVPALVVLVVALTGTTCGVAQSEANGSPASGPGATEATSPLPPQTDSVPPQIRIAANLPEATAGKPAPAPNPPSAKPQLSPWATEIVKLSQAGIDDSVVLSFIDNSGMFNLGADEIIDLKKLGVSNRIVNAMLQHDYEILAGIRQMAVSSSPPSARVHVVLVPVPHDASRARSETSAPVVPVKLANSQTQVPPAAGLSEQPPALGSSQLENLNNGRVDEYESDEAAAASRATSPPEKQSEAYRVRKPYPVSVTDPIIVVRAAGRTPNVFLIDFPR